LAILPENLQPYVRLFVDESTDQLALVKRIKYKYFDFKCVYRQFKGIVGIFKRLAGKLASDNSDLDLVYPFPKQDFYRRYFRAVPYNKKVYWMPDFQEEHFPHFFSENERNKRRSSRSEILLDNKSRVVFSSHAALEDMKTFYPGSKARTDVLHFANPSGVFQSYSNDPERLMFFGVEARKYYISPNQFWKHKNHTILVRALSRLSDQGADVTILLTGREDDPRHPDYFPGLKEKVFQLGLEQQIRFLGFLPKDDLFTLIAHARALIQPSLFEGWSTTIEDAIALNIPVICSDLKVNREQLGDSGNYFDPFNADMLANLLVSGVELSRPNFDLRARVSSFAQSFLELTEHNV
jgi:glycosyltransferase involved in cell wall biosynthesis